jgi:hypothetical protein
LDACAQLVGAARRFSCTTCGAETAGDDAAPAPEVWLQTGVDRFRAFGRPSGRLWGLARLRSAPGEPTLVADVRLLDNGERSSRGDRAAGAASQPGAAAETGGRVRRSL